VWTSGGAELEVPCSKYGRGEEAFEEDQGPHRAVEPMMMTMATMAVVKILLNYNHKHLRIYLFSQRDFNTHSH
jgi:hypothetical protein